MVQDSRLFLTIGVVGAFVIYGIYIFPPLTDGGSANTSGINQVEFDAVIAQELTHCRDRIEDADCSCFANISGNILTHRAPDIPGAVRADRLELARGQATQSC